MLVPALAISLLLASPAPASLGQVRLAVSSPEAPRQSARRAFRATKIIDLEFNAAFRERLSGDHLLEFKVYSPNGKLYQVLVSPFTGGTSRREGRRVHGFPRRLQEQEMREETREQRREARREDDEDGGDAASVFRVNARLPVAGTWIVTNSLYGSWRVDAYLDGASAPVGTAHFSIAP